MDNYDRILVPTDGSEGAEVTVEHAAEIAEKFDAEVHTVYVVDVRAASTQEVILGLMEELREIGDRATESIAEQLQESGVEAVTEVEEGIPHKEINSYVEENDINLVVMGTHGRTGLNRLMVGSTTEKVVRTSTVPVMTVRR